MKKGKSPTLRRFESDMHRLLTILLQREVEDPMLIGISLTRFEVTDANGEVQEVFGEGVIGKQPYLRPGEDFSYTSGTILATPVGSMQGNYLMRSTAGRHFDAPIAPFSLATPNTLH